MSQQSTGEGVDTSGGGSHDELQYRCPRCSATYGSEILTRVHITLADNDTHKNHNGLMPDTPVHVIGRNGEKTNESYAEPNQDLLSQLSLNDVPSEYEGSELNESQRRAILTIARNCNRDITQEKLTENVNGSLREHGLEELSISQVRWLLYNFYHKRTEDATADNSKNAGDPDTVIGSISDLKTEKQQALVIARLAHPDWDKTRFAREMGVSRSYPSQVFKRFADLLDELNNRLLGVESFTEIVAEELEPEDIDSLIESGLLDHDSIEVDLEEIKEFQSEGRGAAEETTDSDSSGHTDGPVTSSANPMSASPHEEGSETGDFSDIDKAFGADSSEDSADTETANSSAELTETAGESETEISSGEGAETVAQGSQTETTSGSEPTPETSTQSHSPTVNNSETQSPQSGTDEVAQTQEGSSDTGDKSAVMADDIDPDAIPREDVERIYNMVQYHLDVIQRESQSDDLNPRDVRLRAHLEQLSEEFESVL
jgi:hypothetical protein